MQEYTWGCVGRFILQLLNAGDGLVHDKMPDAFQHIKSASQHFSRRGEETVIKRQDLHQFEGVHPFQPRAPVCWRAPLFQVQPHPFLNTVLMGFFCNR